MTEKLTAKHLANWQGYLSLPEVAAMKELARMLEPAPVIVKIGAGAGTDSLAILEERDDALIFSIDIHCCDQVQVTNEHLRLPEAGYGNTGHVIRIWGDSKVVGKRWPYALDMVFVDGDHSEKGKRGDIKVWLPKIINNGIMAFHNYGSEQWPAVKPVIDEMMADHERIMLVDSLIAFQVTDYATEESLSILQEAFEKVEA